LVFIFNFLTKIHITRLIQIRACYIIFRIYTVYKINKNIVNAFIKIQKNDLSFLPVSNSEKDIEALYKLLNDRSHNISHNSLTSFNEHKSFVLNHPYREWFLIKNRNLVVGSIYILKSNGIGININNDDGIIIKESIEWILTNFEPLPEIKSIRSKYFHINVHPDNKAMSNCLSKLDSMLIEHTYILRNK
jgi:hypothetical protein